MGSLEPGWRVACSARERAGRKSSRQPPERPPRPFRPRGKGRPVVQRRGPLALSGIAEGDGALDHGAALPRVTDAGKRNLLFNLACTYALAGRTSEALDRLEKAVAEGFGPREAIEGDDDLASLRGEARYAEIVAKAKPRS